MSNLHPVWRISATCLIIFLLVVLGVTQSSRVQHIDQDALEVVYHVLPVSWCEFLSWWGDTGLYLIGFAMAAVLLFKRQWMLLTLGILIIGGGKILESTSKTIIARPRPEYADAELAARSYSFPSGHTLLALIVYGFLLYLLLPHIHNKRTRIALICIGALWVVLIGASRIILGEHYPTDVVGSLVLGVAWLGFWIGARQQYRKRFVAIYQKTA